jgi:hypothetical protein
MIDPSVLNHSNNGHRRYGFLILVLAAPAMIPGIGSLAAPLAGLGGIALGLQLMMGRNDPWLPKRVEAWIERPKGLLRLRARMERLTGSLTQRLRHWHSPRVPRIAVGLMLAWSAFLLALPLAFVPFGNVVPGLAMGLLGTSLLEAKQHFAWIGMALSGLFTTALGLFVWLSWASSKALFGLL